jgi:uncharacterized protein YjiS (DUF1127 family)
MERRHDLRHHRRNYDRRCGCRSGTGDMVGEMEMIYVLDALVIVLFSVNAIVWGYIAWKSLRERWAIQRAIRELQAFTDHELKDIGVTRGEIDHKVRGSG